MFATIRKWARRIKSDIIVLWFARKHPDTPLLAKIVCVVAVVYALSPIDLIPDFIPILGYLDDVLLVPALIWLALRLLPPQVVLECRVQTEEWVRKYARKPKSYIGGALVILVWCVLAYLCWRWLAQ